MAQVLKIDEVDVGRSGDLQPIDRSFAFNEANAKGAPAGAIAREFFEHYMNERNRGTRWDRTYEFEGMRRTEEEILEYLYIDRRMRAQDIADELNLLAGTAATDHGFELRPLFRANNALGLATRVPRRYGPDIEISGYGFVKKSGRLQVDNAMRYIDAHYFLSTAELAQKSRGGANDSSQLP